MSAWNLEEAVRLAAEVSRIKEREPGEELYSAAEKIGELLKRQLEKDPHFYFFSPDETTSNKFDAVFEVESRAWGDLPVKAWDLPEAAGGRVIEMLSENVLFSVMTGHLANGEQAMLGSYEAFLPVVTSQILQQMKFIKQSREVEWREPMPAVNLLSTSVCWRQDHNGFTHQSPALISQLLSVPSGVANCIFPVDDVAAEAAFEWMLKSRDVVNLTTFDKNPRPRYLNKSQAKRQLAKGGVLIYDEVSDAEPDLILAAAGDIVTGEAFEAAKIIREDMPETRLRLVGIGALSYRALGTTEAKLSQTEFTEIFTSDKPILANFHGYPETLENILENYTARGRLRVHGFNEEGSTTTPFEMLRRNAASRYDLAIDVAKLVGRRDLVSKYEAVLEQNHLHAVKYGQDLVK